MPFFRIIAVATLAFVALCLPAPAHADCADPYRKAYEEGVTSPDSDVGVTRLNYYAKGAHLCITKPPLFCENCEIGKAYECRGDEWEAVEDATCTKRAKSGKNNGASRRSGSKPSGFANAPTPTPPRQSAPSGEDPGSIPVSGACSVLGTC